MSWSTGLFGFTKAKDRGCNCLVQNCCCQPCTWADALQHAGIRDSSLYALALVLGGRGCCDEFAGFTARRQLARHYDIEESQAQACIASMCCPFCARWQELNTVLERERLDYACASTKRDATATFAPNTRRPRPVSVTAPTPVYMTRPGLGKGDRV